METIDFRGNKVLPHSNKRFIKIYADNLSGILNLNSSETKLLLCLAKHCDKDTNMIDISPEFRKELADELDIGISRFNHVLSDILRRKDNLITRGGSSRYIINPAYVYNGRYDNIARIEFKYVLDHASNSIGVDYSIIVDDELYEKDIKEVVETYDEIRKDSYKQNIKRKSIFNDAVGNKDNNNNNNNNNN